MTADAFGRRALACPLRLRNTPRDPFWPFIAWLMEHERFTYGTAVAVVSTLRTIMRSVPFGEVLGDADPDAIADRVENHAAPSQRYSSRMNLYRYRRRSIRLVRAWRDDGGAAWIAARVRVVPDTTAWPPRPDLYPPYTGVPR